MEILKLLIVLAQIYFATGFEIHEETPGFTEIEGYHFHTYFFHNNANSVAEANTTRLLVIDAVKSGRLEGCTVEPLRLGPFGPHIIGQFKTCCYKRAHSRATSWFMQNRGNLSVLLHALTRYAVADHSDQAMFLGPSIPLDLSILSEDSGPGYIPYCPPVHYEQDNIAEELPSGVYTH